MIRPHTFFAGQRCTNARTQSLPMRAFFRVFLWVCWRWVGVISSMMRFSFYTIEAYKLFWRQTIIFTENTFVWREPFRVARACAQLLVAVVVCVSFYFFSAVPLLFFFSSLSHSRHLAMLDELCEPILFAARHTLHFELTRRMAAGAPELSPNCWHSCALDGSVQHCKPI